MEGRTRRNHRVKKINITIGSVILLYLLVSFFTSKIVYDKQFPRYDRTDETLSASLRHADIAGDYPRISLTFPSGEHKLHGYLYGSQNDRGLMVIAHGLGGGADSYLSQITHFVDRGLRVFAYDCTGSHDSEGASTKGFPQSILDLHAALTFIGSQEELERLPVLLFGHSWGGYAVANILAYPHEVAGVISVSGVNSAMDMIREQGRTLMGPLIHTQLPFIRLYQLMLFGSVASSDAVSAINGTSTPVLIIHGAEDELVSYHESAIIAFRNAITNPRVSYITSYANGRNGHDNLFRTDEAIETIEQVNATYRQLYEQHGGNIPLEIRRAFYQGIDRIDLSRLEPTLMHAIDSFIDEALGTELQKM